MKQTHDIDKSNDVFYKDIKQSSDFAYYRQQYRWFILTGILLILFAACTTCWSTRLHSEVVKYRQQMKQVKEVRGY